MSWLAVYWFVGLIFASIFLLPTKAVQRCLDSFEKSAGIVAGWKTLVFVVVVIVIFYPVIVLIVAREAIKVFKDARRK